MAGGYEKLKLLGSGSYGKAWLVNCRSKKKQLVLKEIKLDTLSDKEITLTLVEVKVLSKCRHVNIISYCEAFERDCCLHIVMEYAEHGDLQKKIIDQRGIHFNTEAILDWFIQICFALKYLHNKNILHRDLKPQNLFLTSDSIVKVGDFGIARILQDTGDYASTAIGTPYYLSPEICQQRPYDSSSDMWSLGCVLYELCSLRVPFQAPNLPLLVLTIVQGQYDPIPGHCGAVLEDLVSVLLHADPSWRPTAQQVLSVPALQHQVSLTYRRCLRHKELRHDNHHRRHQNRQQRLSSNEPASPIALTPQKVKTPTTPQRTFNLKSPLVRRLSVATPKLKAAIKRQRSVQSAEPVPTRKRRKEGIRPPVFDLQEAVKGLQPASQYGKDCDSPHKQRIEQGAYHQSPLRTHDQPKCLGGREFDFPHKQQKVHSSHHQSPHNMDHNTPQTKQHTKKDSRRQSSHSSDLKTSHTHHTGHDLDRQTSHSPVDTSDADINLDKSNSYDSDDVFEDDSETQIHPTRDIASVILRGGNSCRNIAVPPKKESVGCFPLQGKEQNSDIQFDEVSVVKKSVGSVPSTRSRKPSPLSRRHSKPCSNISVKKPADLQRLRKEEGLDIHCDEVLTKKQGGGCQNSEKEFRLEMSWDEVSVKKPADCLQHLRKEQSFKTPCNEVLVQKPTDYLQSPRKRRFLPSDTYTVLTTVQSDHVSLHCPLCDKGAQPCLSQALYRATALRYSDKMSAQRCLSKFLISHLGSDLSLRLCSLVNAALKAEEDYGTLETHLGAECRMYLPVIFYLLSWSEKAVAKT